MNLDENKRSTLLEALKNTPDDPKLLVQLADVEFKLGCVLEALDKYKKAAILGLYSTENKINIVKCFYHLNKFNEANVAAEQIMECGEENAEFYSILCKIAIAEKKFALAEEYYGYSVDMDDSYADSDIEYLLKHKGQQRPPSDNKSVVDIEDDFDDLDLIDSDIEEKGLFREIHTNAGLKSIDGMADIINLLEFKVIQQDQNPSLFKKFGQRKGGSILLFGPSGCGKEKMAKALSFDSGRPLFAVGTEAFGLYKSHEVKRLLDEVFITAGIRENCILLFNNLNGLFDSRQKDFRNELSTHFHEEISLAKTKTPNIYTIATSNAPWELNGSKFQFDNVVFVSPPMHQERKAYLVSTLESLPASTELNLDRVASETIGFTYHDLKKLVDKAAEQCLIKSLESGSIKPIANSILLEIAASMQASSDEWLRLATIHGQFGANKTLLKAVFDYMDHRD